MTRKEIRTLRDIIGTDPVLSDEEIEYVWMSVDRQDPMKPDRLDGFRCRGCSGKLARQTDLVRQKYCHHCGQKLDWEE